MKKPLTILFANGGGLSPYLRSGAEFTIDSLLRYLSAREVKCFGIGCIEYQLMNELQFDKIKDYLEDYNESYNRTIAFSEEGFKRFLEPRIQDIQPDLIITQLAFGRFVLEVAKKYSIPAIYYVHSLEAGLTNPECFEVLTRYQNYIDLIIVPSQFTHQELYNRYQLDSTVIYPIIDLEPIRSINNLKYFTLINTHPAKGIEIALELATIFTEEEFLFVEGWFKTDPRIVRRIEKLSNVKLVPFTFEIGEIYSITKTLLVPSTCRESFGRVVVEAQAYGIAVIAHAIGGIPEALGRGGILIQPEEGIQGWVNALQKIKDGQIYGQLMEEAKVNRVKFVPQKILTDFDKVLEQIFDKGD